MGNPTTPKKAVKPEKPHPDFPLFPHATGRWAKKVRGKMEYFGPWDDPQAALTKWLDTKDDLLAGRIPRARSEGLTVRDLVNHFLTAKQNARNVGELSDRSFADYYETCSRILDSFGERRVVSDLRADDFGAFRNKLTATRGPVTLGNEIQRVRTVFKHAFDNDLMPAPVKFGSLFKKPSKAVVRIHRQSKPTKFFGADEVRAMLKGADGQLKAMILLGINCGWGNKDVAGVKLSHFNLKDAVATYSRAKTGVSRRATLWPETVKAVKAAIEKRPEPKNEADADLVFITKYGNPWRVSEAVTDVEADRAVRRSEVDSVGLEFGKLLRKVTVKRARVAVTLKREGVNFYTLRHTFKTIAEGAGDIPAVDRIMGHEDDSDTGTHYREWDADARDGDKRLRKVTDYVRGWLFRK